MIITSTDNGDIIHGSTDSQLADALTKALVCIKFMEMRLKLGVMEVQKVSLMGRFVDHNPGIVCLSVSSVN